MKRKFYTYIALSAIIISILASCKSKTKGKYSNISNKTGIPYNKRETGGFEVNSEFNRSTGPGLVAIEGGTFTLGGSATDDVVGENNNSRRRITVPSFYMDETEVSNTNWLEYLHWIGANFPGDREYYYNELPDTLVWRNPLSYNEPYVENYLRHPAYQDYPVVGITWEQAERYCKWRTDRVNENMLRTKGYLVSYDDLKKSGQANNVANGANGGTPFNTDLYLNGQIKGEGIDGKNMKQDLNVATNTGAGKNAKGPVRPIRLEDGEIFQAYRLPTEAEWEYAALGLYGNTENEDITDNKVYPWNGFSLRSPKGNTQGLFLANFRRGRGDNMGVAGYLNDDGDLTVPVKYYLPNDYGLYNMAGNVNEWTGDVYRQLTFEDVNSFNPFRGNQFTEKQFEDKATGKLAKDKYGRAIFSPSTAPRKQTWEELQRGTPAVDSTLALAEDADSGEPYNPDARGYLDTVNKILYKQTTLVNDKSRVFKGGSWNDGAYWLNPATRRFMDQDRSSSEVGFRCAMTMLGAPETGRKSSAKPHFKKPAETRYNPKKRVEKGTRF